jgi:hypothetical protein
VLPSDIPSEPSTSSRSATQASTAAARWTQPLAALVFFIALAIAHTWPLAAAPGTWSRVDNADYTLNAWALAWVVHQAPRDPLHLFDANIFYPEKRTLAFSEHLVPQAAIAAPVVWAGGSAVLAANVAILAGFILSGWITAIVVWRWTGDWVAGLVAGSLIAFNAHTMVRIAHVQALHTYYLPLALAALDRLLDRARWRDAAASACWLALQALTSGYWLVFTASAAVAAMMVRAGEWWPWRRGVSEGPRGAWRRVGLLAGAAAIASVILLPFVTPYWQARQEQGLTRSWNEVQFFGATGFEYLTPSGTLHMLTPLAAARDQQRSIDTMFPGVLGLVLTGYAIVTGLAWRDRRARMFLAIGVAGFLLSLGPHLPLYQSLYTVVPLFQGIRATTRYGFLVLVAVAGLSGFAVADVRVRSGSWQKMKIAPTPIVIGVAALVIVNAEAWRAPMAYKRFEGIPKIYDVLASIDRAVLIEVPTYRQISFFQNADYMLASTVHWKPLVNGYSGFQPRSFAETAERMRPFPDDSAIQRLKDLGVTHVMIHRDRLGATRDSLPARMEASGRFRLVTADHALRLYELVN